MQTFAHEKTPIIPPHCLWVSGLLLISGCRAGAGLPRLHRAWRPAGNRLAMGEKAPGAWGAPGADPLQELSAGLASLWAGGTGTGAVTACLNVGSMSLVHSDFLLCGDVSRQGVPVRGDGASPDATAEAPATSPEGGGCSRTVSDGAPNPSGIIVPMPEAADAAGTPEASKAKVMFFPKPQPWNGTHAGNGKAFNSVRPASFCSRIVTFTPKQQGAR